MFSRLRLRYTLYRLQQRSQPDRGFVKQLERTLFPKAIYRGLSLKLASSVATLTIMIVGTMGYVAETSADVVPGHVLYPVRLAIEDARLKLASNPQQKDQLIKGQLARRVEEAKTAVQKGVEFDPAFGKRVEQAADEEAKSEEVSVQADSLNELMAESPTLAPEEKKTIDKVAYDQTADLASDAIADPGNDDTDHEPSIDLEENLH